MAVAGSTSGKDGNGNVCSFVHLSSDAHVNAKHFAKLRTETGMKRKKGGGGAYIEDASTD